MNPLTLDLRPLLRLTHREFEQIAAANRDLRLELTADGELIVMPPTGGNTGRRNADLTYQLQAWSRQTSVLYLAPNRCKLRVQAHNRPAPGECAWHD
ncbi:MAG: Uma2 family endonuclease, partial [Moorea sp. SIO2B7]|nr:Uma2 family endonuclease [Moorena sp. SIO2B7]